MNASHLIHKPDRQVFLFGPQALAFDTNAFSKLHNHLHETPDSLWALESIVELPKHWGSLIENVPRLQHVKGDQLLHELGQALQTGIISPSLFPLPNIILSPLVVIDQLTQYSAFVRAALPDLDDADDLPSYIIDSTETTGLCTGILSAFAVGCSPSLAKLRRHGSVAVALAMLVGALVDADEASPDSDGSSMSFSMSWNGSQSNEGVDQVLKEFPEAYVSVCVDEKRSTVTASRRTAPKLLQQLKSSGVHITEVSLSGRFHWIGHQEDVEKLISFCECTPEFQFPDASKMVLPSRLASTDDDISTGGLHKIALRDILFKTSQWLTTCSLLYSSNMDAGGSTVICFGSERCVPPTIARKLGSCLVHVSDIELSGSQLPVTILGRCPTSRIEADDRIAVVGMACHVPGAEDLDDYWKILSDGQSQHREVPSERFGMRTGFREHDENRKWYGNFIEDFDTFDHKFFKKSPREMASTDPQHRLILKLAYQAIEQSGYFGSTKVNSHIGCYMGVGNVDYDRNIACYPANAYSATGNLRSFIAGKVSHHFGWTGPSLTVDTACSSSGVAVHQACRAIINGECTSALAGGVNVLTSPEWFYNLAGASFLSPTGQCKPFDKKGDGYCRGEGAGVVFLKRLSSAIADGDQVLGVIASSRVYQNQNCTAITVPNAVSLSELFTDVLRDARLEPQTISVVEAHGTGTPVGDPAEYDGIRRVLGGSKRSDILSVSSVKGLIGHTEFASGVVSLVKILLMINKGFIPPQASFSCINPSLKAVPEDMMEIPTQLKPWDVSFRAALINNYGASGSNASLIITQRPMIQSPTRNPSLGSNSARAFPFWFCGSDVESLQAYAIKFKRFLQLNATSSKDLNISNLSFQVSRQSNRCLPYALTLSAASYDELDHKLCAFVQGDTKIAAIQPPPARPVILCFGGQVSTFVGLARDIFNHFGTLRSYLDRCNTICLSLGLGSIYPDIFQRSPVRDTVKLQTILFAIQYSCAKSWIDSGVNVAAVVGHSFGELTALCVSGAYSLNDALKLVSARARLIRDKWGVEKGSMLAVEASVADVTALLADTKKAYGGEADVSIACYNGPRSFTIAGSREAVELTEKFAKNNPAFSGMKLKKLNVTNAFHSTLVNSLMGDLEALGRNIAYKEPTIHIERATETKSSGKPGVSFVAEHLRNPVFFSHAVQRIAKEYPSAIWLEAGSKSTSTTMASRALGDPGTGHHFQSVNITSEESFQSLVDTTTKLWEEGLNVAFWGHHSRHVTEYTPVLLPPYQFEKSRHWLDLKELPKFEPPVAKFEQLIQVPRGLTTFVGYQGHTTQSARFKVNTTTEKFQRPTLANVVINTTAVTPGNLHLEIALDALMSIRPNLKKFNYQPEIRGVSYQNILVPRASMNLYLDAVSGDEKELVWEWKLYATDSVGTTTSFSSGTVIFWPASDPQLKDNYDSLSRLSGRKRCTSLLNGVNADDVLQGRNVYRAFEQVVNYKEPFRHVTKIAGKDNESAGRVTKAFSGETWIDPILTECFCQVAGIFINLMTDDSDLSERGIFVCDGIARWICSPRFVETASLPEVWEVFAVHQRESETKYISDVFAFDSRDGSLVEAIIGISYQKVPMDWMHKLLTQDTLLKTQSSTGITTPASTQSARDESSLPSSNYTFTPFVKSKENEAVEKAVKAPGPDISAKTIEIVANLSGVEPEDIKERSDLVELGIDSLMAMELVREVDAAFKCTLRNDQLMDLTDFQSLVLCIQSTLGFEGQGEDELSAEEAVPIPNRTVAHVIGLDNNLTSSHNRDVFDPSMVQTVFRDIKWTTDEAILKGQLGTYYKEVMPRSTELCIGHIVNAFEQLGCPIRSAAPGQRLERVPYLSKHERFMKLIYKLLEDDARLIDIKGSDIKRTAVAPPVMSVEALLQKLLHDEPVHAAEHKLTSLVGAKFADLITGKEDGLQLIFGTPESREIASDMYANSPINTIWIKQLGLFLEQLIGKLPKSNEPICILEIGGGTGGTTSRIIPLLAQLGVPIKYTMTDISGSLIAAARRRFKQYPFMEFKLLNMESQPEPKFLQSQHIILATNCVHATRDLSISLNNLHQILRPDGFLVMLEMTEQVPWVDFMFGLLEGWWLFEDGRSYVLQPATYWEKVLHSVGYGHVDWTDGDLPEADIQRLIIAHASGPRYDRGPKPAPPRVSDIALSDSAERGRVIDEYVHKYTEGFLPPTQSHEPFARSSVLSETQCVLVTGATGSLGAHIVAYLVQRPDIHTVVCVNRLSSVEATLRQRKSLEMRGISLNAASLSKLKVIETDTSKPMLGLSLENYQSLVRITTHVVHSAWPMSLTRPIRTYESQLRIVRNLIDLARDVTNQRPIPFRFGFQFVSSSAVVANYPLWTGRALVPEQSGTIESVPATGYAEAKLAAEHILAKTLHRFPDRFHAMAVRIAQISGSTSNGYWNPTEYIPFLIKSSQMLNLLPDLDGDLSWYPVNDVAATLGELLMAEKAAGLIYHIDNPSRQAWRDMIAALATALNIAPKNVVPYKQWIDRVRRFRGSTTDNPALQLIEFFDNYFIPMSCGGLVLDTTRAREHSATLQRQGSIDSGLLNRYIARWKQSKFL